MSQWKVIIDGEVYNVTSNLRFIRRDNRKVLQQMYMKSIDVWSGESIKCIWRDVPLTEDNNPERSSGL